ncbi:MAG: hypothetical protein OXF88_22545 [Rhodobacteraceae bacterium]|nr:hypothetical protein [Paracoccaceae bacterium]
MKPLGYTGQGGLSDDVQFMMTKGHAFIGHMVSKRFSVVDCQELRNPKPMTYVLAPL